MGRLTETYGFLRSLPKDLEHTKYLICDIEITERLQEIRSKLRLYRYRPDYVPNSRKHKKLN